VRLSTLSRDDLETVTTGAHKINMFLMGASGSSHLNLDSWQCREPVPVGNFCDECTTAVFQHWEIVLRGIACGDGDPLTILRENVKDLANNLCDYDESTFGSNCRDVMESRINDLRIDLFNKLPFFFVP
jgi:hypothetical protein